MSWSEITVVITALIGLGLWCVWVAASRLDRLHRKMNASRAVVETQLVRRATVAAELATSGLLDPVSSVLVGEAAWASLSSGVSDVTALPPDLAVLIAGDEHDEAAGTGVLLDRSRVESELSATLREALDDEGEVEVLRAEPAGDELLSALGSAWYRLQLARRFHNEAVAQAARARRGPVVRALRLAGRAPTPRTLDLDDEWPESLGRPGVRAHGAEGARPGA
ncbi:hypothetical protein [Cellulomonas sp. URHB0016]